jgi:hypothetical protein
MDRDSTQDWLLPAGAKPPSVAELQSAIEQALAVAHASERAVISVGAAALDAAEQARRAASIAERAAATALQAQRRASSAGSELQRGSDRRPAARVTDGEDDRLRSFTDRANRVGARLLALQRSAVGAPLAIAD